MTAAKMAGMVYGWSPVGGGQTLPLGGGKTLPLGGGKTLPGGLRACVRVCARAGGRGRREVRAGFFWGRHATNTFGLFGNTTRATAGV